MVSVNLLLLMVIMRTANANTTTTIDNSKNIINKNKNIITNNNVVREWRYNDDCTNECDDNDNRYWCGKYRKDSRGNINRCVQYTKRGEICVDECAVQANRKYTWCHTNYYVLDSRSNVDWWDYCSMAGYTINKEECWDDCDMRGENYFWCHTSVHHKSKWDYCSPPGLVKPVQMHIYGDQCINQCDRYGQDYYWCARSRKYCDVKRENCNGNDCDEYLDCDSDWEYCSIDEMHTRYGVRCKERCSNAGKSYYWCNTVDGSWDYCSPKTREGIQVSLEIEVTRYNVKCKSVCKKAGYDYFWCNVIEGNWDYCSPEGKTIHNNPCTDACERRGKNYFWCNTASSWDYCSPRNQGTSFGYTSVHAGAAAHGGPGILLVLGLLLSKEY